MKTRTLILISIFLLSVTFLFAGGKDKISKKDFWNDFSGTWINTEYLGKSYGYYQRVIVHPDGQFEYYALTTNTSPRLEGYSITITEAWIDSQGVIWYTAKRKDPHALYELGKISESGNRWEFICDGDTYPTEWDTSLTRYAPYMTYYRQ